MDASDQSLLSQFLTGKDQAFRDLSQRHMNLVYGVALRNTADPSIAEEVVQDVFVLLARKARSLVSHPSIAGWLHKTSRNVARDARRKRIGHQKKLKRFAEQSGPTDQVQPALDDQLIEIDSAVSSLPTQEREAILLRFFEDREYREIADQLSITEPAARKRVSRGIKRLHSDLRTRLAAGTALALTAPAYLNEAVASSATSTITTASATTSITNIIMAKSTAITIGCATLLVGTFGYVAADQSSKRKGLAAELAEMRVDAIQERPLTALGGFQSNDSIANESETNDPKLLKEQIAVLERQLSSEKEKRELTEEHSAQLRKVTDGLEDQIVVAFGKPAEIGADFGDIFKEALALSKLDEAGELENDENRKRLIQFSMKAATITGLSKQIIALENEPEEGSRFFSATYKSIFDLDDATTSSLERVFSEQIAAASERDLTLVNNPQLLMLEDDSITEEQIDSWEEARHEFYRGVRLRLRDEFPPDKLEDFDRYVEQDGIGFTNLTLGGNPLAFSLGGRQD